MSKRRVVGAAAWVAVMGLAGCGDDGGGSGGAGGGAGGGPATSTSTATSSGETTGSTSSTGSQGGGGGGGAAPCPAGTRVDSADCTPCDEGTFSDTADATECEAWVNCGRGTYVEGAGTSTSDRTCARCAPGTVTFDENAPSCTRGQIAAGDQHTCVLKADGAVRCWGSNSSGQLGQGNITQVGDDELPSTVLDDVDLGEPAVHLAAGFSHTCAVLESGAVRCWGFNGAGQLGLGHTDDVGDDESPASVDAVDVGGEAVQVAAGGLSSCALRADGGVRCWGRNGLGQLGLGHADDVGDDELVGDSADVPLEDVAVWIGVGDTHACALLASGAVQCWGSNYDGVLGLGHTEALGDDEPVSSDNVVPLGGTAAWLAVGAYHSCARVVGEGLRCWGYSHHGQLGYGSTETVGDDETPADAGNVMSGFPPSSVDLGDPVSCALRANGSVRCWGYHEYGQLGFPSAEDIGDDEPPSDGSNVTLGGPAAAISVGHSHTCALLADHAVRCWGFADSGRLGYGNLDDVGDDETPASVGDVSYE